MIREGSCVFHQPTRGRAANNLIARSVSACLSGRNVASFSPSPLRNATSFAQSVTDNGKTLCICPSSCGCAHWEHGRCVLVVQDDWTDASALGRSAAEDEPRPRLASAATVGVLEAVAAVAVRPTDGYPATDRLSANPCAQQLSPDSAGTPASRPHSIDAAWLQLFSVAMLHSPCQRASTPTGPGISTVRTARAPRRGARPGGEVCRPS